MLLYFTIRSSYTYRPSFEFLKNYEIDIQWDSHIQMNLTFKHKCVNNENPSIQNLNVKKHKQKLSASKKILKFVINFEVMKNLTLFQGDRLPEEVYTLNIKFLTWF